MRVHASFLYLHNLFTKNQDVLHFRTEGVSGLTTSTHHLLPFGSGFSKVVEQPCAVREALLPFKLKFHSSNARQEVQFIHNHAHSLYVSLHGHFICLLLCWYRVNFIYWGGGGWKELISSGIMSRTTIVWLMDHDELLRCGWTN